MPNIRLIAMMAASLFVSVGALGTIIPDPKPVEDRFAEADIVCICEAIKTIQTNSPTLIKGKLPPADFDVTVRSIKAYKSIYSTQRLTVRFAGLDPLWVIQFR